MYQAILSFGDDVEIISPVEVRDTMKEITNKMHQFYN